MYHPNKKTISIVITLIVFFSSFTAEAFQTINCNSIPCIQNAMANAQPGDEIVIASGTYNFSVSDKIPGAFGRNAYLHSARNGTSGSPIVLRGASASNRPVIKGVNYDDGYLLGLEGNHWTIRDIEFRTGSKGVILDNADFTTLENLEIHDVGEEALHFRHGTTYSSANNCSIHDTGRNPDKTDFGEGVYIGSDRSVHNLDYNDIDSDVYCPDWKREQGRCGQFYNPSVNNIRVTNCDIGPNVTAEHFDVREGSCQIFIEGNTMDARGIINKDFQDSFMDLKGAFCYVRNNTFNQNGESQIEKGIQVLDRDNSQDLIELTAYRNVIHNNTFNMDDTGTPILTYFEKRNYKSDNYAYNNRRNPSGQVYQNGSDFIESMEPDFGNVNCPSGNQGTVLSVNEFSGSPLSFSILPNPVNDVLTISTSESIKKVSVYTLQGQQIIIKNDSSALEQGKINVSSLSTGVYVLAIKTQNSFGSAMLYKL